MIGCSDDRPTLTGATALARSQVAAGHFVSLEQAVAVAIADLMAATDEDLDWARPLVNAASAELARGEGVSGDEAIARIRAALRQSR